MAARFQWPSTMDDAVTGYLAARGAAAAYVGRRALVTGGLGFIGSTLICRIIADNLNTTRLADRARVHNMPVARFLSMKSSRHRGRGSGIRDQGSDSQIPAPDPRSPVPDPSPVNADAEYDIIILDPPYADPAISTTLEAIALSPLLAQDGLVVIGHANRVKLADEYGDGLIRRVRHRAMGDSAFSIYEVER